MNFTDNPMTGRAPALRIAILGWGSLLWDASPRFDAQRDPWDADGPILKLEFSRISQRRHGALTLVIDAKYGAPCRVSYAVSKRGDPELVIADLRDREATNHGNIGFFITAGSQSRVRDRDSLRAIREWAIERKFDAVVWTDLENNFEAQVGEAFTVEAALEYVETLDGEARTHAVEYLRRLPATVTTPLRSAATGQAWYRG